MNEHGSDSCYVNRKCRCVPCREAVIATTMGPNKVVRAVQSFLRSQQLVLDSMDVTHARSHRNGAPAVQEGPTGSSPLEDGFEDFVGVLEGEASVLEAAIAHSPGGEPSAVPPDADAPLDGAAVIDATGEPHRPSSIHGEEPMA